MRSHGKVLGLIPYDLRAPSPRRLLRNLWNPRDERFFVPTSFGIGWGVNLGSARRHPFRALLFAVLVARAVWNEFLSDRDR